MSAYNAWTLSKSLETLHVRMDRHCENALALAQYLETNNQVESVKYPDLKSHPQYKIAKKQMTEGFGAMLSVQVKGTAKNAMKLTGRLKLFTTATSLGGVESLVEHRKSIEGPDSPTPDNLLRISVGLEHVDDLIADWKQALR